LKDEAYPYPYSSNREYKEYIDTFNYIPEDVKSFESPALIYNDNEPNFNLAPSYETYSVNSKRKWNVSTSFSPTVRDITLKKQTKVNGRTINIWVEDSEYASNKINDSRINEVLSSVSNVYTNVVNVAGEPWGAHNYGNIIAGDNQPLDIVFINFKNDNTPFGTVGYFWSRDNFLKTGSNGNPASNEALAINIDTETYYLGRDGKLSTLTTIAHELVHAINFYQRDVLMGDGNVYATFLNEMTAVMMEDIISGKISSDYNDVAKRYIQWLDTPLYNQDFSEWKKDDKDATSYSVAGSFGAFLLRQHGMNFYKKLLKANGKSKDALEAALKDYGGLNLALRNWGASIAMFPAATAPKGFGYPARNNDNGFSFKAFDGNTYRQYRKLFTSSPGSLAPNAHFPFLRKATNGKYEESFVVPSGVSVSIVVK
jgi:hypothetical protein